MQKTGYSVLMSIYEKEKAPFFRMAAESMLNQTIPPKEIVLVCDGPLGANLEAEIGMLKKRCGSALKILRIPSCKGLGNALRVGVEKCSCELVARMDTDDIAVPNRMESQLSLLKAEDDIAVVGGQIAEFWSSPDQVTAYRRVPCSSDDIRQYAARRNPMNHMTVTFRRDAVLSAGNYREFDRFEDYDLWARMLALHYRFQNLDQVLVYARVAPDTYRRRGGMDYFRQTIQMQKQLRRSGIVGAVGSGRNLAVRFIGTVLLPNRLRSVVYQRHLRSKQ